MNNGTESLSEIINDNEPKYRKPSLDIVIDEGRVEVIADLLVEKLGYVGSRPYYCKVARLIPWDILERLAIVAKETGRHSGKLFTHLTKQEIARRRNSQGASDE